MSNLQDINLEQESVIEISHPLPHGRDWVYAVRTTHRTFPVIVFWREYRSVLGQMTKDVFDRNLVLNKILGHKIARIIKEG